MLTIFTVMQELGRSMKAQLSEYKEADLIEEVITAVCRALNVEKSALRSPGRTTSLVEARYIIMYLLVKEHKMGFKEVGAILNRDHSSIMAGIEKYQSLVDARDKAFLYKINTVIEELEGAWL